MIIISIMRIKIHLRKYIIFYHAKKIPTLNLKLLIMDPLIYPLTLASAALIFVITKVCIV